MRRAHFSRGHRELAMAPAGHIARDGDVVGFVGQDHPGERTVADARHSATSKARLRAFAHETAQNGGVRGVAASEVVRAEPVKVAEAGHGFHAGLGRERGAFDAVVRIERENLIDLVGRETADFNRRIDENELVELEPQRLEVPFALLRQPVDRQPEKPSFAVVEMSDPDARQAIEAEKPHTLDDRLAVDNFVIRTNQDRLRIAEPGDGIGNLPDMRGIALTQTTLAQLQIVEADVDEFERRQQIVAAGARGRLRRR